MTITEKVSYLRGLADGLAIDENTKEGKVLLAIIDTLDDMAFSIADMEENLDDVSEQVNLVDEDLEALEDDFYEYDEDEAESDDYDEEDEDDEEDEWDDDELYEVRCPACGDTIYVDDSMLEEGEMDCPNCHEHLEFDFSCDGDASEEGLLGDDEDDK